MFSVELIPKQSVLDDVVELWERTGRKSGIEKGAFYFSDCEDAYVDGGTLKILKGKNQYYYSASDFYRVKISKE
jgi:hypothetical protein